MSLVSRLMAWLNPHETEAGVDDADHDRRLVLANRRQQQQKARVERLEAEAEVMRRRRE